MKGNHRKLKKRWLILIIPLILLTVFTVGGYGIFKVYLGQIGRITGPVEDIIAPEDEFFDVDEPEAADDQQGSGTSSGITSGETGADDKQGGGTAETPLASPTPTEGDSGVVDPSAVEWSFIERIEDDHLINILLVGQDRDLTRKGRQRSDSMILCSINPQTGKVAMISFLRDLYVQIPGGYSDNRLNVPFVLGGFPLLDETLTTNFGVSIDANVDVDMTGFIAIINMLGGLDLELTSTEAEYMRNTWDVPAVTGINHFDGKQTLWFSRIRKIGSDFGRTSRQREVLLAIFAKVKDLPVNELLTLLYDMLPYLTTDLTDSEILSLAYRLLPLVSSLEIETHSVPSRGTYTNAKVRGMAVLLPDREKIRTQLVEEYLPLG